MNTIQLTPEIEDLIAQQIKTGKYQDDLATEKGREWGRFLPFNTG